MKTTSLSRFLKLTLASTLVLPLCNCSSEADESSEVKCWVSTPDDGSVSDGQLSVEVGFSGPVDTIELVVDGEAVDNAPVGGTKGTVSFDWKPPADATYSILARANGATKPVDSDPVSVLVDSIAPVITIDLPRLSVVNGEVEVPYTLTEANLTKLSLKVQDGVELASAQQAGTSMLWDTGKGADGVNWIQIEATDEAGHTTLSDPVPAVVVNNGEEVEVEYIPAAKVSVPANYASVEYHSRVMAAAKAGVRAVVTWITWDDPSWMLEYSLGQGICPHRGIQYIAHESSDGEIVLSLARNELSEQVVARLPAAERKSDTFPKNNDPATFGSFFGHINPLEPADHVNQSLPVEVHCVFLY